jgi:hypothetical protein
MKRITSDMDGTNEHGRKPARRIAPMRDLPIVALIAGLAAMFWLQG